MSHVLLSDLVQSGYIWEDMEGKEVYIDFPQISSDFKIISGRIERLILELTTSDPNFFKDETKSY